MPQYDFEHLVPPDLGPRAQAKPSCVNADMTVSGAFHHADSFRQSYLQYGTPKYDAIAGGDFAPVTMYGRVYARYFAEWESSVFFYVMAPSWEVVNNCDRQILQKSKLR